MNNINKDVADYCKDLNGVNFIKLINDKDYDNGSLQKRISFVIEYKEPAFINFNNSNKLKYYYGLSPELKTNDIKNIITTDILINNDKLKTYLKDHGQYFNLDKKDLMNKYGEALFARCILGISLHYGFIFKYKEEDLSILEEFIDLKNNKLHLKMDKEKHFIAIKGRPTKEFIEDFPFNIKIEELSNESYKASLIKKDKSESSNIVTLLDIYEGKSKLTISLLDEIYYSGVLPKLKKIVELEKEKKEKNPNNITYKLIVERTTFAFLESFDKTELLKYEIMAKYKDILIEFNENEYKLENEYIHQNKIDIDLINKYLNETSNINNIAVSANIITKDNYVIYGYRNGTSIDANSIYCSFNGQSEILDKNVDYYNDSAYEDYPTIDLNSDMRKDFKNEFAREMMAELSLTGFEKDYRYLGISILGIHNEKFDPASPRRLHFNILAEHKTDYTFKDVLGVWDKSLEAFENKLILGIKHKQYKSKWEMFYKSAISFLKYISSSKEIILLLIALITGTLTFGKLNLSSTMSNIFTGISISLSIISIGFFIYNLIKIKKKTRAKIYTNTIDEMKFLTSIDKKLSKLVNNKAKNNKVLSPIGVLMTYLDIYNRKGSKF